MSKTFRSKVKIWIKKKNLKKKGIIIHNNTVFSDVYFKGKATIEPYCRLSGDPKIIIGDNFYLNSGCHLLGAITIGNDVMIGPKTVIWGRDHGISDLAIPMNKQPHISMSIVIKDDVWISANVTILKGVTIGKGVVIGAGAVVTKDVPDYGVAVGNPAKVVKYRE